MEELNAEQHRAYAECMNGKRSVFCTGVAGSGKSFVLSRIVAGLKEKHIASPLSMAVTASTGSAAYLIGGSTLHSFAGTGFEEKSVDLMWSRVYKSAAQRAWKNLEVLIIDEVSMVSSTYMDNLSEIACRITGNGKPFGGIRLIMFGDFLQLPPVSPTRDRARYAFQSEAWIKMDPVCFNFTQSHRHKDTQLASLLSNVRIGACNIQDEHYIRKLERTLEYDDEIEPVILCARKDTVAKHNAAKLSALSTKKLVFRSVDSGNASFLKQCPVEASLELRIGAQVMLVRNMSTRLFNGAVGTVVSFEKTSDGSAPVVKFLSRQGECSEHLMELTSWVLEGHDGVATRKQFPIILAWAMTIHKSQGKTIPRVIVDMKGIFEKGQCYVGLSRCPDSTNMQVLNFRRDHVKCDSACINFYRHIDASVGAGRALPPRRVRKATGVAHDTSEEWANQRALEESLDKLSIRESFDQ